MSDLVVTSRELFKSYCGYIHWHSQKFCLEGRGQNRKSCDLSLVTFFWDEKQWRPNCFFKVRFRRNQFEKQQFGQITQLQVTKTEGYGAIFETLLLK